MPAKIRLQRYGKKGAPFYHIVIADGRAPRDGKFIERIGSYNPITIPATIELDVNKALDWLQKGAQPTDTAKTILSFKGVIYKNHLMKGVKKGAFTAEQAEEKFATWLTEKQNKIQEKILQRKGAQKSEQEKRLETEVQVNEARSLALQKKRQKAADAERESAAAAKASAEAAVQQEETPAVEAPEAEAAQDVTATE